MAGRSRPHVLTLQDRQPPILGRAPIPPPQPASIEDPRLLPPHRALIEDPRLLPPPHSHLRSLGPHSSLLIEERLVAQHQEIDALLLDNQRLAATHVALKQEVNIVQHELRLAAASAAKAGAEKDAEVREVYERFLRVEVEARALGDMRAELAQVQSDVQLLGAARVELVERLQGLRRELAWALAELGRVPAIQAQIDSMQAEVQKGRAAVEYEKKTHADNLEQSQTMQKSMITMGHEIENLRAELSNAEKRAKAASTVAVANPGPGYAGGYGNLEMAYGGSSYTDTYSMPQVQNGRIGGSQYVSGPARQGPYDMQYSHVQR